MAALVVEVGIVGDDIDIFISVVGDLRGGAGSDGLHFAEKGSTSDARVLMPATLAQATEVRQGLSWRVPRTLQRTVSRGGGVRGVVSPAAVGFPDVNINPPWLLRDRRARPEVMRCRTVADHGGNYINIRPVGMLNSFPSYHRLPELRASDHILQLRIVLIRQLDRADRMMLLWVADDIVGGEAK